MISEPKSRVSRRDASCCWPRRPGRCSPTARGRRAAGVACFRMPPMLLPSPSNPLVALRVVMRVGSQIDPAGKEGLAALTAAMVAEGGTKSLSYDQLLEAFYPMAASVDGACHKEVTVFSGTIHRDNLASYFRS